MTRQGMALLCMTRPVSDVTVETQSDWGYSLGVGDWKGPSGHIRGVRQSVPPRAHHLAACTPGCCPWDAMWPEEWGAL